MFRTSNPVSQDSQPTATATLTPSTKVVFGKMPGRNEVVPAKSGYSNYFTVFEQRSFHRVAIVLGLGSAALVGWYIYQHYYSEDAKKRAIEAAIESVEGLTVVSVVNDLEQVEIKSNGNQEASDVDDLVDRKVTLFQCPRGYFTPCIAPFALKLETFLRVATIPYDIKFKSQPQSDDTPWITIGPLEVVESQKCIPTLCQIFNIDFNKDASESRKSAANLVDNTLENRIFWGIALWRWVYDNGNSMREIQPVAVPMASQMIKEVSDSVKKASWYHGIGRHSPEEVIEKVNKDINDLSVALGKHNYFMGEHPGEVDCNAFAMLSQMVWNMPKSPFEYEIKKYDNLISFIVRMKVRFWPDWEDILNSTLDRESLASESVRLYSTGEFTRSRTGVSSQNSKASSVRISREASFSSTKSKKSIPEVHQTNSSVGNVNALPAARAESEVRKRSSSGIPTESDLQQQQQLVSSSNTIPSTSQQDQNQISQSNNIMPSQSQPEHLTSHNIIQSQSNPEPLQYTSTPTTNPFLQNVRIHNNMSQDELNTLMKALAHEQQVHNQSAPSIHDDYSKTQSQNGPSFNSNEQQHYQNAFLGSKSSPFPGQVLGNPAPMPTSGHPQQSMNIPSQPYGHHAAAYSDQAKFYQIRDAIHAVTAQSTGARESYSSNIFKLNQILNDLSISQPQTTFEHSVPQRQWNTPAGLPQHQGNVGHPSLGFQQQHSGNMALPQQQNGSLGFQQQHNGNLGHQEHKMYSMDPRYDQQQPANSTPLQIPITQNNPFMY